MNNLSLCENLTVSYYPLNSVRSVTQSCPTLQPHESPGLPVHHQLLEVTQTHVHWVDDAWVDNAIQPAHPLSSPSPAPNPSQH